MTWPQAELARGWRGEIVLELLDGAVRGGDEALVRATAPCVTERLILAALVQRAQQVAWKLADFID